MDTVPVRVSTVTFLIHVATVPHLARPRTDMLSCGAIALVTEITAKIYTKRIEKKDLAY